MPRLTDLIQDTELLAAEAGHYDDGLTWPGEPGIDCFEEADFGQDGENE